MSVITQAGTVSYGRPQTIVLNQNEVLTVICTDYSSGVVYQYDIPPILVTNTINCPSDTETVIGPFAIPQQFSIESIQNNVFFETRFSAGAQETPQIEIGAVNTIAPGLPATVTNVGTPFHAILDFGIPQGWQAPGFILFGATNSGASTAVRYLFPSFNDFSVSTLAIAFKVPTLITAKSITIFANAAGTGGANITYTLYKNGIATALTITLNANSTTATFSANVTFFSGDTMSCIVQCAAGVNAGYVRPIVSIGV